MQTMEKGPCHLVLAATLVAHDASCTQGEKAKPGRRRFRRAGCATGTATSTAAAASGGG